jgi:hypothetical protein
MTLPSISLRGVSERDVDLLLVEELSASSGFRAWFSEKVGLAQSDLAAVARSVISSSGESDIELTFQSAAGTTKVLVENKIDAVLQPRQSERYAERGEAYVGSRLCDTFMTVLIAPDAYGTARSRFDARVSYEQLREWFQMQLESDARAPYKLALLDQALERAASGWTLVPDPAATSFWQCYWRVACEVAPELQMPAPGSKPATSGFIRFRPAQLPAGVELLHKVPYGNVDLQFAGMATRAGEFARAHVGTLAPGMRIEAASKSLVVRIAVPSAALEAPFESSATAVREALCAARRLLSWYEEHIAPVRTTNGA